MTAQVHERLVYDGEELSMACAPPVPTGHPRVRRGDDPPGPVMNTACWRGYQGTWEIRDGRLYLVGLSGNMELVGSDPIFAEWFSGTLRVPRGEILEYVHMGFETIYEKEEWLTVRRGEIVASRRIEGRAVQRSRFPRRLALGAACTVIGVTAAGAGYVSLNGLLQVGSVFAGGWLAVSGIGVLADLLDDWQIHRS